MDFIFVQSVEFRQHVAVSVLYTEGGVFRANKRGCCCRGSDAFIPASLFYRAFPPEGRDIRAASIDSCQR